MNMASVTEYLEKLQKLTQKNLDILQAINDAFYSDKSHLLVNVDGEQYTVPSFIHLENKLNALQDGFNNLVYAPKTGEASFNFDGNSQTIELKGFTCTPESVILRPPFLYDVENNHIFKDFLTPNPYINFDLSSISNDISKVCIKKIVAISQALKDDFSSHIGNLSSDNITYEDLYKKLSLYESDKDYIEYDSTKELPVRKSIGSGTYVIKSIDDHKILNDLTETYTLTISNELKYKLFDNVIEKYLQIGDELVTYDDSAKVRILDIYHNTNQIIIEVMNGDYLNLVADTGDINYVSDMSKLKFYSPIDKNKDRYINIPLEEDQYIAVFVAPLNNRMNIRAPWGTGVIVNTYSLNDIDGVPYKTYYDENVNNIGDILYELTTLSANGITKYTEEEFKVFSEYKPVINNSDLNVYQINTHLNNSPTIQKIRSLYSQKNRYTRDLDEIQNSIDNINITLSTISFDDTTNIRVVYENQLTELNKRKNEITSSINKVINDISAAANESEIPIENAKYRIRGFYNITPNGLIDKYQDHINGIRVWYRYKNQNQEIGSAQSIGTDYIFSDWNEMPITKRLKHPKYLNSKYNYDYNVDNSNINEPSFNQIDIPITQGEIVDIKMQIIWDFGYPFIETTSTWSDIISVNFPDELKKNIKILDIIEENNNEIEKYKFSNILETNGITKHVDDKLIDQDITFYHQPEHVSSGFYTSERRIIPLKDKLINIDNDIKSLKDEVFGYSINNLSISTVFNNISTPIYPNQENIIYISNDSETITYLTLEIANKSDHNVKLYSILPGSRGVTLNKIRPNSLNLHYAYSEFMIYNINKSINEYQRMNQYIYFRNNDAWTGNAIKASICVPSIKEQYKLCVESDSKFDYLELKPNESISIPLRISNSILITEDDDANNRNDLMQFSIRTSLYTEPTTYELVFSNNMEELAAQYQTTQTDYNSVVQ